MTAIEKTKQYYNQIKDEDICDCAYCKNYVKEIRSSYTNLADYLDKLGIDIKKPFETNPVEPSSGMMYYCGAQYIVMGSDEDFKENVIGDVRISITDSHPTTDLEEEHFVIEICPIYLKWSGEL